MRSASSFAVLCALILLSCTAPALGGHGLRTVASPLPGTVRACTPARLNPFRVIIDPTAADPVSGLYVADGTPFAIEWPPGFVLLTEPELAVADSAGKIVARNGDVVADAGGSAGDPAFICAIGGAVY